MAEREDLKRRDDKFRKDDPDNKSGQRSGEPGRQGNEPGRQGQGGSGTENYPGSQPRSQHKGTGSDDSE
ncbi:MAG TPA: hypothetical protein VMQ61_15360 [Thermoanaerobaculia bacterium]|nr:hypothetical protein [Thermoanaerobaculia bacterium]